MIIELKRGYLPIEKKHFLTFLDAEEVAYKNVVLDDAEYVVTSSAWNGSDDVFAQYPSLIGERTFFKTDAQLSMRSFKKANTVINLGDGIIFGANNTVMVAGPCAVESEMQVMKTAEMLNGLGVRVFRAGAYKPRTSPYTFQGLEEKGLQLLSKVRKEFGMKIITEVKDETHLERVAEVADVIQVGTKSMYHFTLLSRCGQLRKPILLKRGFMSTLKEFLQAADFIMSNGNSQVILCERGIRTFETQTRFALDVCSAALLKELSHLPIALDPSHAVGLSAQVPLVAQSAAAMEVDAILIETHCDPSQAKCDKDQAISLVQFERIQERTRAICSAVGRNLI